MIVSIVIAAFALVVVGSSWGAQPPITESWVRQNTNSQYSDDYNGEVAVDRQGNVIVTGPSAVSNHFQYLTAKYAAEDGRLLWSARFNSRTNSDDIAIRVAVDAQDDVIVTGYASSNSAHFSHTIKYSGVDGVVQWQRAMTGQVSVLSVDQQGNALLGGRCFSAKLAATNGAILWEKRAPYQALNFNIAILPDKNGDVIVDRHAGYHHQTAKLNGLTGATIWENTEPPRTLPLFLIESSRKMMLDDEQNVIVCHFDYRSGRDFDYLAKFAATNGLTLWRKDLTNLGFSYFIEALTSDPAGNVIAVGQDGYIGKYSGTNGGLLWGKFYDGQLSNGVRRLTHITPDKQGNFSVVGYSYSNYFPRLYTAKISDLDGSLLWEKEYSERVVQDARVHVQPNGNTVASTATDEEPLGNYSLTVLYAPFLPRLSVEPIPSGVRLQFPGIAGRTYEIQHAPLLNGSWNTLLTTNSPVGGLIVHTNSTVGPAGFFRVSAAP